MSTTMKKCSECDIISITNDNYCSICGTSLIPAPSSTTTSYSDQQNRQNNPLINSQINPFLSTMLDLFGIDLQQELSAYYNNQQNSYQLSEEYLVNLGKIEVDANGTIFYNCTLSIGPLQLHGISSNFSQLPFEDLTNLQLLEGNPIYGESPLLNSPPTHDSILYFRRGVVSFATKALSGQLFGAKAVIISQNSDRWPFLMTNSTSNNNEPIPIPVIMISQSDGQLLEKYLSSSSSSSSSVISLSCQQLSKECIICQEIYQQGDKILKLPCCHLYHESCLFRWLSNAQTCPLCRLELPKEKKKIVRNGNNNEGEDQRGQREEQERRRHDHNYFV